MKETTVILQSLRQQLRQRGMTYSAVAKHWEVSVSQLARIYLLELKARRGVGKRRKATSLFFIAARGLVSCKDIAGLHYN